MTFIQFYYNQFMFFSNFYISIFISKFYFNYFVDDIWYILLTFCLVIYLDNTIIELNKKITKYLLDIFYS